MILTKSPEKILEQCEALETPHVVRRQPKYETRQLLNKCSGHCEDLKNAKARILELEEENKKLIAKLDEMNENLRIISSQKSQESTVSDCLRLGSLKTYTLRNPKNNSISLLS